MVGFPHSEIFGSKLIRSSPKLIAAYYVLHRLHAPRHPLNALKALDRSHYRCPQRPAALLSSRPPVIGLNEICHAITARHFDRSDQINQNSRGVFEPPRGCRVKRCKKPSLYDVERSGRSGSRRKATAKLALCVRRWLVGIRIGLPPRMVEPDGIEPTTSCLQSTRSPN
jgi:hypothetical protein